MSREGRRAAWWLALGLIVAVAIPVAARAFGIEAGPLAMLVALMPWVTVLGVLGMAVALLSRSRWLTAVAAVLAVACVAWQAPLFTGGGDGEPTLTVATANLRFGEADADAVVAMVRDYHVDVLAVSELTAEAESALIRAGLTKELRFYVSRAEDGFAGTGLWARYPVSDVAALPGFLSQNFRVSLDAPGGPIEVYAVHPRAPRSFDHHIWESELASLRAELATEDGPAIVAGDFNTTRDHAGFRDIESLGYADAADQAGSGFVPTFPVGRGLFPPMVIDHVLERDTGLVALRTLTVTIPRTDHRALVVEYGARP